MRCLIIGSSGCGKTTLTIDNFLLSPGWMDKKKGFPYIHSSLDLLKYIQLQNNYEAVQEILSERSLIRAFIHHMRKFCNRIHYYIYDALRLRLWSGKSCPVYRASLCLGT
jgi:hypothetical protein